MYKNILTKLTAKEDLNEQEQSAGGKEREKVIRLMEKAKKIKNNG